MTGGPAALPTAAAKAAPVATLVPAPVMLAPFCFQARHYETSAGDTLIQVSL